MGTRYSVADATHISTGPTWRYLCRPIASHLNHDGKANGITRVVAFQAGHSKTVDVGTCTLRRVAYVVRGFEPAAWLPARIRCTGETVFSTRREAEPYQRRIEARQLPGHYSAIYVELATPLVQSASGRKVHLAANVSLSVPAYPRCGTVREGCYRFVRDLRAVVTCERCKTLGTDCDV